MRNRLKIHMCLGVEVESVHLEEHGVALNLKNRRQLKVDKVLYAAGRQSNTAALLSMWQASRRASAASSPSTKTIKRVCRTSMRRAT
jgi:thioredoxin reductase